MSQEDDVGFLIKTMIERDPKKRRVKPVESLINFDLDESSDDSDFRIEDHCEESDDDSVDSNDNGKDDDDDDNDDGDETDESLENQLISEPNQQGTTVTDVIQKANTQAENGGTLDEKLAKMRICCGCLGDRSDDINEIVDCDGCGVTVHEGCYGVSDVESFSSTNSVCQSAPWFCEACSAGIQDPSCELCPNKGGIFKETDVGKWVHLVCALYVPGVAFGEVDRLASVTLFEMAYSKWGSKTCSLCEDSRYARTGVCIECDAGMCHTYFHVTCAQRQGLLSEAHSEEVDQADPFYAHCKLHSDKALVKRRRRNWLALQSRAKYKQQLWKQPGYLDTEEQRRIQRKLAKHRHKYLAHKAIRPLPWVPTQKMPRLLTTSASACRQLAKKAELMGIETAALEAQEAQLVALVDVRKKWHIQPAFSVEFIGYYLDRNLRVTSMKRKLQELLDINSQLLNEQQRLDRKYDEIMKDHEEQIRVNGILKEEIESYHRFLRIAGYIKPLPMIGDIAKPRMGPNGQLGVGLGVPTAAALKMGVGFPLPVNKGTEGAREGRVLSSQAHHGNPVNPKPELTLRHQCGICRRSTNQHLLAKCDTCHLHYHLSCLTPPLTRMPKKTKLMGWQCSECDKESSGSDVDHVDTSAPRKLRHCKDDSNASLNSSAQEIIPPPLVSTTTITPALTPIPPIPLATTITTPKLTIKPVNPHPSAPSIPPTIAPISNSVSLISSTPIPPASDPSFINSYHQPNIVSNNSVIVPREGSPEYMVASADGTVSVSQKSAKKRRREKHKRYTPDPITGIKQRKRKHKRKSMDIENPDNQTQPEVHRRITIKIKPIPRPDGEDTSTSSPQMFVATSTSTEISIPAPNHVFPIPAPPHAIHSSLSHLPPPMPPSSSSSSSSSSSWSSSSSLPSSSLPSSSSLPPVQQVPNNSAINPGGNKRGKEADMLTQCNVCSLPGTLQNLVMCDECKKCYHFTCLDPPVKKSPKRRGYSWHCADCDPSASESEN